MRISIALVLMAFIAIAEEPRPAADYFPLSDTARWEYSVEVSPSLTGQNGKQITRADGKESINGKEFTKLVFSSTGIPGASTFVLFKRRSKEGVFEILKSEGSTTEEHLILPDPPIIGKTWDVKIHGGVVTYKIEGLETADLPEKSYKNCLKISKTWTYPDSANNAEGYLLCAPGIGVVKEVFKQGELRLVFLLESFKK